MVSGAIYRRAVFKFSKLIPKIVQTTEYVKKNYVTKVGLGAICYWTPAHLSPLRRLPRWRALGSAMSYRGEQRDEKPPDLEANEGDASQFGSQGSIH